MSIIFLIFQYLFIQGSQQQFCFNFPWLSFPWVFVVFMSFFPMLLEGYLIKNAISWTFFKQNFKNQTNLISISFKKKNMASKFMLKQFPPFYEQNVNKSQFSGWIIAMILFFVLIHKVPLIISSIFLSDFHYIVLTFEILNLVRSCFLSGKIFLKVLFHLKVIMVFSLHWMFSEEIFLTQLNT